MVNRSGKPLMSGEGLAAILSFDGRDLRAGRM